MSNLFIAYPKIMQNAEVSASNQLSSDFPASFLLTTLVSDRFRTNIPSTRIIVSLEKAAAVSFVGLISTNFSPKVSYRIYAANDKDGMNYNAVYDYDSGALTDPENVTADLSNPSLSLDFMNDNYIYGYTTKLNRHFFHLPSSAQTYRHWMIDISDPGNPQGELQIGRVMIGTLFQPVINVDLSPTVGFIDPSIHETTFGGGIVPTQRGKRKTMSFRFGFHTEAEMMGTAFEIDDYCGSTEGVFACMDSEKTTYRQQYSIYGLMPSLQEIVNPFMDIFTKAYRIEELVP